MKESAGCDNINHATSEIMYTECNFQSTSRNKSVTHSTRGVPSALLCHELENRAKSNIVNVKAFTVCITAKGRLVLQTWGLYREI